MYNQMGQMDGASNAIHTDKLTLQGYDIHHHGAVRGVTGSCHELQYLNERGNLEGIPIDCGLFQGIEEESYPVGGRTAGDQENLLSTNINFEINHIKALVVTHVHIDHVGRIPYLLAKGFKGPIHCSEPSAHLLSLVLEDALKVGFTRNKKIIEQFLPHIEKQIVPVPYNKWQKVSDNLQIKLKPAGHILGSAYVLCKLQMDTRLRGYDDVVGACLQVNNGRSQHVVADKPVRASLLATNKQDLGWSNLEIIIDSPLAAKFTDIYQQLSQYWDKEARRKLKSNRKPLKSNNVLTINGHNDHLTTVEYLAKTKPPAIVIAASGMCNGGRIMNYLKAMLNDPRHDVLFVGYQAKGTIGRIVQKYGPKDGYVDLDGQRITINAKIHTIGGYSAHAGQKDLLNFVRRMWKKPNEIRLIHGGQKAKEQVKQKLSEKYPKISTWIPKA